MALDTQGVVDIIEHLSNGLKGAEEDRVKRSRTDNLVGTEQCAVALMHFLESQDLETISAAPIIVSTGLQSLSDILDKQASLNASVADYLQQALLSMMTSAVTRIEVSLPALLIPGSIILSCFPAGRSQYGKRSHWCRGDCQDDQRLVEPNHTNCPRLICDSWFA